jgi:hypothetical protein
LVSDTPNESLAEARRVASALYPGVEIIEHLHAPVLSFAELEIALRHIERHRGIVLYHLGNQAMIRNLREVCVSIGCPSLPGPRPGTADNKAEVPRLNEAMRLHFAAAPRTGFGVVTGMFAGFLMLQAGWLLVPELLTPKVSFPVAGTGARSTKSDTSAARIAAFTGYPRGELWANYAISLASSWLGRADGDNGDVAASLLEADEVARRAAELAPHDARIWLLLAALGARSQPEGFGAVEALKMSYYTGPNMASLRALRIAIATHGDALSDPELASLVTAELGAIIMREPDAKPSILRAYRNASPDGKRFLEEKLAELDPKFMATIRSP